jgi:hypothetical protein
MAKLQVKDAGRGVEEYHLRPRRKSAKTETSGRQRMSFLSALFGGGGRGGAKTAKAAEPVEYKGYVIRAAPYKNEGQYQTAGVIEREVGGVRKQHRFVRADAYASYDDAVSFTLNKARQIIDLQGERMFDQA